MPSLLYTNPWMLSGLAALTVPVIIHLLLRHRKKKVRFSTIQFFAKQDQQSSHRRKLRNWLLLAMRLLLVALLVTAFARPFLPQGGASSAGRPMQQVVFVLDRSASMLAVGTDGQRWSRAKELLQKKLAALDGNDRAALVGCSTHAEVLSGFVSSASLAKTLAKLEPAYSTSNLGEGLQQAAKLAAAGAQNAQTTIYIASDLQRSACENVASYPISQEYKVEVLGGGDVYSPNLSITELRPDSREGVKPGLVVSSFSDEDTPEAKVEVAIDNQVVYAGKFSLRSGATTNIDLALPTRKPGWHDARASLQTRDALALDNTRHAAFFVPEPVRALIAETRQSAPVYEQDSFFLAAALDPSQGTTNPLPSDFTCAQVSPEELASRLSGSAGRRLWDLVILPALKDISPQAGRALADFVQAGGGLLVFLGEGLSANRYNNELQSLLPGQLGTKETAPDMAVGWRIGEFNTNAPAFACFGRPNSGDLSIPRFLKRYALTPNERATTLAFFEDGAPLVLSGAVGRGRVVLVNSSADTTWSDWPKHKTFVPWLHGLGKQLTPAAAHGNAAEIVSLLASDELDIDLGTGARKSQFALRGPGGQTRSLMADDLGRLRDPAPLAPGIYSLQDREGREIRRLSVNLPPRESDLAALRPLEFQQQLVRVQEPPNNSPGALLFGAQAGRKELWKLLLLAALGLLMLETIVSNRTSA